MTSPLLPTTTRITRLCRTREGLEAYVWAMGGGDLPVGGSAVGGLAAAGAAALAQKPVMSCPAPTLEEELSQCEKIGQLNGWSDERIERCKEQVRKRRGAVPTQWGWKGGKKWRDAVKEVLKPGTHENILGHIPTIYEALALLKDAGVDLTSPEIRIQDGHSPPNPHTYPHINYPIPGGGKGTIRLP